MRVAALVIGSSLVILPARPAMATPIAYLQQERLVRTQLMLLDGSPLQEITWTAIGLFDEMLSDSGFDEGGGFASAFASQTSVLGSHQITMSGRVEGFGSTDALGQGRTELDVLFELVEATPFSFDAFLDDLLVGEPGGFSLLMRLMTESGDVVFSVTDADLDIFGGGDIVVPPVAGELDPGVYRYEVTVDASGFKDTSNMTGYQATLVLPGPGAGVVLAALALRRRRRRLTTAP